MKDQMIIIGCDEKYVLDIKNLLESRLDAEVTAKIHPYDLVKKFSEDSISSKDKSISNLRKFKNLIETTKTAYLIMSVDGVIKEVNDIFLEIINYKDSQKLVGVNISDLASKNNSTIIKNSMSLLNNGIAIEDLEICLDNPKFCKNGIWIRMNANIMENGEKNILCLIKDITNKKIEEFSEYIHGQKQKDRVRQSVSIIRNKIQSMQLQAEEVHD
jgi:PAS domain S-box-containing protein